MAEQDSEWIYEKLQRAERKIENRQAELVAAIEADDLPELIAFVKRDMERLIEEKEDLLSALKVRLASPAGEVPAVAP